MYQIEKLENNKIKVSFVIPSAKFDEAREEVYNSKKDEYEVPGFTKGQAPFAIAEASLGPSTFYSEAGEKLITEAFKEFSAEHPEVEIIAKPTINVTKSIKGNDFEFTMECEVMPEYRVGDYKNLKITMEAADTTATDDEADRQIAMVMQRAVEMQKVDRAAELGDTVVIDFEGFLDGTAFEGGKGEKYPLGLGSHSFIPGFEEELVGCSAGEEKDVHVTFPENYQAENLAGKPVVFKCKVHEVQTKVQKSLGEVLSQLGFATLDDFREDVKKSIVEQKEQRVLAEKRELVVQELAKIVEVELPSVVVEQQIDNMMQHFEQQIAQQTNGTMGLSDYLKYSGETVEQLKEKYRPQAETSILTRMALQHIVREEEIDATEEELDAQLLQMGQMYGMKPADVRAMIGEEYLESLKLDITIGKALDYILENIVVEA